MSMRLRDKFRLLAVGLVLAFMAAVAVAAPATPSAGSAALYRSDLGEPAPEHGPACFKRHEPCKPGSIPTAPPVPAVLPAIPGGGLVKAPTLLPAPVPDVAPHAAASLFILFRNLRE